MSRKLIIIRHAKAKDIKLGQIDFDRELSKKGLNQADTMSKMLQEISVHPDIIYSSPAQRTRTTAEIFADNLAYPKEELIFEPSIYEASLQSLLQIVNSFDEQKEIVFLVGHNPGLTSLANYLSTELVDVIPTCGLVCLTFELDTWQHISQGLGDLLWFKTPREF